MCETKDIRIGDRVRVRSGQYIITANVVEILDHAWKVRNPKSGRVYKVLRILEVIPEGREAPATVPASQMNAQVAQEQVAERIADAIAPTVLRQVAEQPELAQEVLETTTAPQKRSLMDAALEVLRREQRPMSTSELVKAAIDARLWTPTAGKTPEQSLYGRFFTEIKTARQPRVRKSAGRGKFELA